MTDQRFRVFLSRSCLCSPCWQARCNGCGAALTKHDFTAEDAAASARDALDTPGHFQHKCRGAA